MTTLDSMLRKLAPLNVYDLSETSCVYAELAAYAEALDAHRANLDEALRECFISSAESYGLDSREEVIGDIRENYTAAERRQMLISRRCVSDNDFTPAAFDRLIKGLGAESCTMNEMPSDCMISVTLNGVLDTVDEAWITNQIRLLMPAHLAVFVYLGGLTFLEIDSANVTFAVYDNADYTWAQLENR